MYIYTYMLLHMYTYILHVQSPRAKQINVCLPSSCLQESQQVFGIELLEIGTRTLRQLCHIGLGPTHQQVSTGGVNGQKFSNIHRSPVMFLDTPSLKNKCFKVMGKWRKKTFSRRHLSRDAQVHQSQVLRP